MLDLKQAHTPNPRDSWPNRDGPDQVPTVVCFIPSLEHGRHFQISVHCWEPPEPTPETLAVTSDKHAVSFEARVIIDGMVTSGQIFKAHEPTPHIIDNFLGQDGMTKHLAFPPFHTELLTQSFWNASENLGRIKVVIGEGTSCSHRGASYERKKNIVCFAFQHAPLSILQEANIAWPNPSMFRCAGGRPTSIMEGDSSNRAVHGLAPDYKSGEIGTNDSVCAVSHTGFPISMNSLLTPHEMGCVDEEPNTLAAASTLYHASTGQSFTVPRQSRANRTSSSDSSMPDYGSLRSWDGDRQPPALDRGPRLLNHALSGSMSDVVYTGFRSRGGTIGTRHDSLEGLPEELNPICIDRIEEEPLTPSRLLSHALESHNATSPNNEAMIFGSRHFDEAFYSPLKDSDDAGIHPPANTCVNSATNSPLDYTNCRTIVKSESPCPPQQHPHAVPVMTDDTQLGTVRQRSQHSQASVSFNDPSSIEGLSRLPAANDDIKGRKEGKRAQHKISGTGKRTISRRDIEANASGSAAGPGRLSEGKRKREATSTTDVEGSAASPILMGLTLSPSRKFSKARGQTDAGTESKKVDEGIKRPPLSNLVNH